MKILVTGATGFLGRSLMRQRHTAELVGCSRSPCELFGPSYVQVDLTDGEALSNAFASLDPDWVVHTAALTDVDRCETDPSENRRLNLEMVAKVVEVCASQGIRLVHVSTDYVFDGGNGPYGEVDPPNPLSCYGRTKLDSEQLVLNSTVPAIVLRTLWLYGYIPHTRPNLVTWPLTALQEGKELKIVDDQRGNPTFVDDLALAILELCSQDYRGLIHMGGGTILTRYEMVLQLARRFGLSNDLVQPISTEELDQKASRPLQSGLKTERLTAALGRAPVGFEDGITRMAELDDFKRAFPNLRVK